LAVSDLVIRRRPRGVGPRGWGARKTWGSWGHEVIHPGAAPDLRSEMAPVGTQAPRLGARRGARSLPELDEAAREHLLRILVNQRRVGWTVSFAIARLGRLPEPPE
jgi:hypothetical protein